MEKFGFEVCTLSHEEKGLTVRLGDNSTSPIDRRIVQQEFDIGGHHSRENFYVLSLPSGFDVVLGMDYMVKHDVLLGPRSKATRIPKGNSWCTANGTSLSTYLNPSSANNLRLNAVHNI